MTVRRPEIRTQKTGVLSAGTPYDGFIQQASQQYGVDPKLIKAVIQAESGFRPKAGSSAGAAGLMQLMPATARELGVKDRFNPEQNIMGGTKYLASMLRKFNGDVSLALAAYNAGPGAVQRHGGIPPYRETQNYVRKVLANYGSSTVSMAALTEAPGSNEAMASGGRASSLRERAGVTFARPSQGKASIAALLAALRAQYGDLLGALCDADLLGFVLANNPKLFAQLAQPEAIEGLVLNLPHPIASLTEGMSASEAKAALVEQVRTSLGGLASLSDTEVLALTLEHNPALREALDGIGAGTLSKDLTLPLSFAAAAPPSVGWSGQSEMTPWKTPR
jgi:hypothetical protein